MPSATAKNEPAPARIRRVYRPGTERRQEIIIAAREAFIRANLAGARTRDIAKAAGVNQATLFKYFPTKEKLFEAAILEPLLAAMRTMHGHVAVYQTAETPAKLAQLAQGSTVQHIADMQAMLPLLVTALFSDLARGKAFFSQHLEPLIRQRGEVLRPLVKDGIEPEFVGLATFGMMFAVALQHWLGEQPRDVAANAAQLNRLATGGFAKGGGA